MARPKLHLLKTKFQIVCFASIVVLSSVAESRGDLVISNINMTDTTLSLSVTGAIPLDYSTAPNGSFNLYFGVPGNIDWVVSGTDHSTAWTNNSGRATSTVAKFRQTDGGHYFNAVTADSQDWVAGDNVDMTLSLTGANLNSSNINTNELIVAAGFDTLDLFPDANFQVGAAVPEPSSVAMLGMAMLLGMYQRRRLK